MSLALLVEQLSLLLGPVWMTVPNRCSLQFCGVHHVEDVAGVHCNTASRSDASEMYATAKQTLDRVLSSRFSDWELGEMVMLPVRWQTWSCVCRSKMVRRAR